MNKFIAHLAIVIFAMTTFEIMVNLGKGSWIHQTAHWIIIIADIFYK